MNLKKIIKEEIDDFSWIEETNPIKIEPMTIYYTLESFYRDRNEDIWSFLKYIEKYSPKSRWLFDEGKPTKLLNTVGIKVIFIHEHMGMSISYNIDSIDNPNFNDYKKVDITGFRKNNFIREGSEDFDWIRNTEPIDLDREVKRYIDRGFVVALWFGNINDDLREHINKFILKEGFEWGSNRAETAWTYGNLVMGLTFYPDMVMGGFHGVNARDDWEFFNTQVKEREYEDINPYKFYSVELDRI